LLLVCQGSEKLFKVLLNLFVFPHFKEIFAKYLKVIQTENMNNLNWKKEGTIVDFLDYLIPVLAYRYKCFIIGDVTVLAVCGR